MSDSMRSEIGQRLKSFRERTGKTQEEVSEVLGIPRSAVSLLESGERGLKVEELQEYARLFHTHIDRLVKPSAEASTKTPVSENRTTSENRTSASTQKFYTSVEEITSELKLMGLQDHEIDIKADTVVAARGISIQKAYVGFHLDIVSAELKQSMIDWVDEISASYPASRPALQINHEGITGYNVLSFLTCP